MLQRNVRPGPQLFITGSLLLCSEVGFLFICFYCKFCSLYARLLRNACFLPFGGSSFHFLNDAFWNTKFSAWVISSLFLLSSLTFAVCRGACLRQADGRELLPGSPRAHGVSSVRCTGPPVVLCKFSLRVQLSDSYFCGCVLLLLAKSFSSLADGRVESFLNSTVFLFVCVCLTFVFKPCSFHCASLCCCESQGVVVTVRLLLLL